MVAAARALRKDRMQIVGLLGQASCTDDFILSIILVGSRKVARVGWGGQRDGIMCSRPTTSATRTGGRSVEEAADHRPAGSPGHCGDQDFDGTQDGPELGPT